MDCDREKQWEAIYLFGLGLMLQPLPNFRKF